MFSRFVGAALGLLVLGADAFSTSSYSWNGTSTVTVHGDDCWSTSTVYPKPETVTKWSTKTVWDEKVSTVTEVHTKPASTVTVTVTEKVHPHNPTPTSQPASVVTVYITTSVVVVSVQPTTETDLAP